MPDDPKALEEAGRRIAKCAAEGESFLDLYGLGLRLLPESILAVNHIEKLDLKGNQISSPPVGLRRLPYLKAIRLYDCGPISLSSWLEELPHLERLDMGGSTSFTFDGPLAGVGTIKRLSIQDARLDRVPLWLRAMRSLVDLDLAGNFLRELPEWLCELTSLVRLHVQGNRLRGLPANFRKLHRIEVLALDRNPIPMFPESLHHLPNLRTLRLGENPLLKFPPEIIADDDATKILAYASKLAESAGPRPLNEAKLIFVGRGGAGKTSLRKMLITGECDHGEDKTEGIEVTPWTLPIKGDQVTLNVWDFGGQEIMHATHQFFLTKRSLYVLVVNAREGEQDANVEYWLQRIEVVGGGSPTLVVVNKCAQHPLDLDERGLRTKYRFVRGFYRTDCWEPIGITNLRSAIERATDALSDLRTLFPPPWFKLKRELEQMEEDCITYEEYRKLCDASNERDEQSQRVLIGFLHDLGSMLHFADDPRVNDLGVLKPDWVTQGIYGLLNADTLKESCGVLAMQQLGELLDGNRYPAHRHDYLVSLMEKFELCFEVPHSGRRTFLIPELLPKETPPLWDWQNIESLGFEYHYNILPEGLLPRFIVRTHTMSEGGARWRHGVELHRHEARALVKADVQGRLITIAVRGPGRQPRELLAVIRQQFEEIHSGMKGLVADEKVPVPGYPQVKLDYRKLLVREANQKTHVEFETERDSIELPLGKLLDNFEEPASRRERAHNFIENRGTIIMPSEHYDFSKSTITNSVVGAHMENITIAIQNLPPEKAEVKEQLATLQEQAKPLLEQLPKDKAEETAANLEDFTKEAAKEKPRKPFLAMTSESLIDAAKTVAAMSGPIIATVEKLRPLLGF